MTMRRDSSIHRAFHFDVERAARVGRFRWFLLGALGVAPYGCGGRTEANPRNVTGGDLEASGATAGLAHSGGVGGTTPLGTGGAGVGGAAGSVGGSGFGGGSSTTGGAGGAPEVPPSLSACANQTPLGGGWFRCDNGMLHRASVGLCESSVPRPERTAIPDEYSSYIDAGAFLDCRQDADCTDSEHGHCEWLVGQIVGTFCLYGCVQNADCAEQQVCLCGEGPVGSCAPASCSQDSECAGQGLCADYIQNPGCGGTAFACQVSGDECAIDADCSLGATCTIDGSAAGHRVCSGATCVIGRPFLVDGRERLAPARARGDWCAELGGEPCADIADPDLRAAVAQGWVEQGLMEHASVAAFARFSLQLMSLGAPSDLVTRAAEAMQDEIRHARACFALARRHAGEPIGPGPLSVDGALDSLDLTSIVLATIAEGCVGETVAALEAAEALAHCQDAAAREVLSRIAVEEGNHAELAWRFVAWAIETGPASLKDCVRDAFDAALVGARRRPVRMSLRDRELLRHGLVSEALREPLRAGVLDEVVRPCVQALLDGVRMHPVQARGSALAVA